MTDPHVHVIQSDIHIVVTVHDEFLGDIAMKILVSPSDAVKIRDMGSSVARLYFGHETGPTIQDALRQALA